ncbi:hypothetical protein ACQP3D_30210, partial [Escherichia coli]
TTEESTCMVHNSQKATLLKIPSPANCLSIELSPGGQWSNEAELQEPPHSSNERLLIGLFLVFGGLLL